MRILDELRLKESPDHEILDKSWLYDLRELRCFWTLGDEGLQIEMELSSHERYVVLRFTGAFEVSLNGYYPVDAIRIIDARQFLPEVLAPICVVHWKWKGERPYFWAQSVELLPK
jgi:hypothetical protein